MKIGTIITTIIINYDYYEIKMYHLSSAVTTHAYLPFTIHDSFLGSLHASTMDHWIQNWKFLNLGIHSHDFRFPVIWNC